MGSLGLQHQAVCGGIAHLIANVGAHLRWLSLGHPQFRLIDNKKACALFGKGSMGDSIWIVATTNAKQMSQVKTKNRNLI